MSRRRSTVSLPNIRRIDSPKSHGYQVHIERDGKVLTKHFSDSRYPSRREARKAAIAYRDQMLAELPPSITAQGFHTVCHSNTGEVGISYTYMVRRTGTRKPYITVSVSPEPGKMLGRKFSIERYGYEQAIELAKAWRAEVLRERGERLEKKRQRRTKTPAE